jgi:TolA-binding protein
MMNIVKPAALVVLALAMTVPASAQAAGSRGRQGGVRQAQASVTSTDIQRLQDQVYDASNEVSRLRSRDQVLADRLQTQLDDLRDEVVYLRVKLRKEGAVSRNDYNDVRAQVDSVRSEARADSSRPGTQWPANGNSGNSGSNNGSGYGTGTSGNAGYGGGQGQGTSGTGISGGTGQGQGQGQGTSGSGIFGGTADQQNPPRSDAPARRNEVPAGQEIDVRIERELNSGTTQVEDRFNATTMVDLYQGNDVLIPAGSTLRGVVSSVNKATRTDRKGSMTVAFDQIAIRGRSYPIHGTVTQALESEGIKGEAAKIGTGAGVGAILGGILGGAKGALLGILIGGGGTIAATEGKDVALPAGSVLRVKFDQPFLVR